MNTDVRAEISQQIQKYKQIKEENKQRHEQWNLFTEDLLLSTLNQCKQWGIEGTAKKTFRWGNLETIYLSIKNEPSIFWEEYEEAKHQVTQHGGHLRFSKDFWGMVSVTMFYPYVKEALPKKEEVFLDYLSPKELTQERIEQYVALFLTKINQYLQAPSSSIGSKN